MKKQVQNFNKSDLAIHLSRKFSSLNDEIIIEGIDLILQEIINTVALDNRVEIRGFGSFSKKTIRPRKYINPMTKKELRLSADISDSLVDEFFQAIKTTLRSQQNIKLSGFGSFEIFVTKERIGRNPKSMENFTIPSQNKVRFSPTSKAKYFLN